MANFTIQNVPDSLHGRLKRAARSEARSLNSFATQALQSAAGEFERCERMLRGWQEYEELVKSLPFMGDSTDLIRGDRDQSAGAV